MSRYVIEMRIPVVVDTDDLEELASVRGELRAQAALLGWSPRFLTAEEWLWNAQWQKPGPFVDTRIRHEAEHTGKLNRHRDRRPAQ